MKEQLTHDRQTPSLSVPEPPKGLDRIKWLGPGFLWMVSAAGSGELLFTPRVGALYGYTLLWALIAAVVMKWFINREIGRYTVCTGSTILSGYSELPGPANWPVWVILVPQIIVAIATIAGLAGSAATALVLVLPGDIRIWTISSILLSTALVLWGRYKSVELVATIIALVLALASIVTALSIFPDVNQLASGLVPRVPAQANYGEILPWLGFALSGAAGMIWYSYWIQAKGYGVADVSDTDRSVDPKKLSDENRGRLHGWISQMTFDNTVAVVGTLIITLAFLILGTELLLPRGLIPEENQVAEVLGRLLGDVWGPFGFWFMILAVFIGFWDTVLSDQDGFGRMFANGSRILLRPFASSKVWRFESQRKAYVVILLTALPIALYLLVGEPVMLLKIAGAVEAAHIPFVAALTLYLNRRKLPADLSPSRLVFMMTALSGGFFAIFALVYILQVI